VLAAVLGLAAFFVVSIILSAVWVAVELATGSMTLESLSQLNMSNVVTPSFFLLNNLSLVACIGIAMAFAAIFFRQRPGWLASVQGRFRWGFFGRCLLIAAPIIAVDLVAEALIAGPWELRLRDHTVFMIVVILLTTPLQCAGEEYLCRGLINRGFGSLPKGRTAGVATGALVSTAVFAVLHGATDPYLIVFYCFFGLACCLLAWKTGGLEAAIAVHAANNVLGMWMVPFTDFSGMFDRGAGTGSPVVLLQMAALALACWLILRQAKRLGLPETGPPPAVTPGR
jgi:membrane protease YdiL (CAAX protease family)